MRTAIGGVFVAGLLASSAFAQSSSGTWNGLTTASRSTPATSASAPTPSCATTGPGLRGRRLRAGPGRRRERQHLLAGRRPGASAGATSSSSASRGSAATGTTTRSSATSPGAARPTTPGSRRPRRPAATSSAATTASRLVRNDRFEIGPTIGVGYLWLNAGIRATGTVSGPGGSESRSSTSAPAPAASPAPWAATPTPGPRRASGARGLPLHQGEARGLRGVRHRLAARGRLLLLQERRPRRAVQVQPYSYDRGILVSQLGGELTTGASRCSCRSCSGPGAARIFKKKRPSRSERDLP